MFPFSDPTTAPKLDKLETQARVLEMADLIKTFALEIADKVPRSEEIIYTFAACLMQTGHWRAFERPAQQKTPVGPTGWPGFLLFSTAEEDGDDG